MNKEIDLSVSCYGKTRELVYDLVLLPWGATEPHNLHLPYLTDCILAHAIAVVWCALYGDASCNYGVTKSGTARAALLHTCPV